MKVSLAVSVSTVPKQIILLGSGAEFLMAASKMAMSKKAALLGLLLGCALSLSAQTVDLAVLGGGYVPVNESASVGNAFAVEGNIGIRVFHVPFIALYGEVPIMGSLNSQISSTKALLNTGTYSALFIAPGLRAKLAPGFPISPYLAIGGGWARFHKSAALASSTGTSQNTHSGVFDIGGGVDIKAAPFLAFRAEVRDFYSGSLFPTIVDLSQRQHNLFAGAGVVVRF